MGREHYAERYERGRGAAGLGFLRAVFAVVGALRAFMGVFLAVFRGVTGWPCGFRSLNMSIIISHIRLMVTTSMTLEGTTYPVPGTIPTMIKSAAASSAPNLMMKKLLATTMAAAKKYFIISDTR